MTKLYCPKGHETTQWDNYTMNKNSIFGIYSCSKCLRPYWEIDCLTEPKKENQVNSPTLKSSEINRIETKISANSPTPRFESHVDDINVVETKVNPLEMQWANPKRESQVAIERVIEALVCTLWDMSKLKISGSYFKSFQIFQQKLEELNK